MLQRDSCLQGACVLFKESSDLGSTDKNAAVFRMFHDWGDCLTDMVQAL